MNRLIRFTAIVAMLFNYPACLSAAQISLGDKQWALLTFPANVAAQSIETLSTRSPSFYLRLCCTRTCSKFFL